MGGTRRHGVVCAICIVMTATAGCASATAAAVAPSAHEAPAGCTAKPVTITVANNGKTMCVTTGTAITVKLSSTSGSTWQNIKSDSTVLAPRADPRPALPAGMTGAAFTAARPGKAVLSSIRFACRSGLAPASATAKNAHPCGAIVSFHATIVVERD
jgi:hypothetical protein